MRPLGARRGPVSSKIGLRVLSGRPPGSPAAPPSRRTRPACRGCPSGARARGCGEAVSASDGGSLGFGRRRFGPREAVSASDGDGFETEGMPRRASRGRASRAVPRRAPREAPGGQLLGVRRRSSAAFRRPGRLVDPIPRLRGDCRAVLAHVVLVTKRRGAARRGGRRRADWPRRLGEALGGPPREEGHYGWPVGGAECSAPAQDRSRRLAVRLRCEQPPLSQSQLGRGRGKHAHHT